MAIERQRIEQSLLAAVERNQLLLKEVNYRVNNSLALVASMLHLKSATVSDEVKLHLEEASSRISAIARAHQRLYQTEMFEKTDLGPYIADICQKFSESLPDSAVHVRAESGIEIPLDQAIPVALFVNELITNSAKYGHANSTKKSGLGSPNQIQEYQFRYGTKEWVYRPILRPRHEKDWGCD